LLLPARELAAAQAHRCVVACTEVLCDELMRVGGLSRLLDLGLRGALLAVADVLEHRAFEEHRLLPYQAHLPAEPLEVERLELDPIEHHAARGRVVEALQQRDEGALARARRAAQRADLSRLDIEAEAAERLEGGRRGVGEGDVHELHAPRHLAELLTFLRERVAL